MERTLLGLDGWPVNVGLQAGARGRGRRRARGAARRRRVRLQDPRGLRRLPGADRPRPALRRRARRQRLAPHRRAPRVGRARGHRRRDRRPDGPRLSRRGERRRARAGPARPRPRGRTSCARRRRRPCRSGSTPAAEQVADDRPQPRGVVRRGRATWSWSRERVHPATMAAEGPLHELGAIGIVNSDSQGMGRMMETVRRTIQLAHVMRGLAGDRRPARVIPGCPPSPPTRSIRPSASCATWPRRRSSPRSRTASPTTSARWRRAGWPTSCCGSRPTSASSPSSC